MDNKWEDMIKEVENEALEFSRKQFIEKYRKENVFEIKGVICTDINMTNQEFTNELIKLIESKNWTFGGTTTVYKEE